MTSKRFWNVKVYADSWFDRLRWRHTVPNIGCIMDNHPNPRMFEKWYNIPQKAHRLMRRLHANDNYLFQSKKPNP